MCFEFKLFVNVFVFGRENKKQKTKKQKNKKKKRKKEKKNKNFIDRSQIFHMKIKHDLLFVH
jgi:ribosomal protein S25